MQTKRIKRAIIAALLFAFFASGASHAATVSAKLTKVKGDVKTRASATAEWKSVKDGDSVSQGAQIKTGPASEVFVGWGGGNVLKVGPLASITLSDLSSGAGSKNKVELTQGKVFAKAGKLGKDSSFSIKTPTAVAGVRGTGFECSESTVSVVEGSVTVEAGGVEVQLEEGMMTEIPEAGAPPEQPEAIPAEALSDLKEDLQDSVEVSAELGLVEESSTQQGEEKKEEAAAEDEDAAEEEGDASEAGDAIGDVLDSNTLNELSEDAASEFEPGTGGIEGLIIIETTGY